MTSAWPRLPNPVPAITASPALEGPIPASGSSRPLLFSLALASGQTGCEAIARAQAPWSQLRWGWVTRQARLYRARPPQPPWANGSPPGPVPAAAARVSHLDSIRPQSLKCLASPSDPIWMTDKRDTCARIQGEKPEALCTQTSRMHMCVTPENRLGGERRRGPPGLGAQGMWGSSGRPTRRRCEVGK